MHKQVSYEALKIVEQGDVDLVEKAASGGGSGNKVNT